MNKHADTTKTEENTSAIDAVETVELEAVTGGCSRCGCGQPDPTSAQQQLATDWLRR